jgi:hypothetical protein
MTRYRIDIDAARRRLAAREHVTDHAPAYPGVLEELASAAWRRTDQYANRVGHGVGSLLSGVRSLEVGMHPRMGRWSRRCRAVRPV